MSFAELMQQPQLLAEQLAQYRGGAYGLLFLGAFFETLIPFSLAILGEVVFLSGALLAGMGALDIWAVTAVLLLGGVLGDNASYWIGRRYGEGLFARLEGWPLLGRLFRAESVDKGRAFFRRRGGYAVFAARLSGPLSWVMPALAGAFRLDYRTFLPYNALGVILGISQFILVGYLFGSQLETLLAWLGRFGFTLGVGLVLAAVGFWRWRVWRRAG